METKQIYRKILIEERTCRWEKITLMGNAITFLTLLGAMVVNYFGRKGGTAETTSDNLRLRTVE